MKTPRRMSRVRLIRDSLVLSAVLFFVSLLVSGSVGFAFFGKKDVGRYYVYQGSRYGAAGLVEVTRTRYLISDAVNWIMLVSLVTGMSLFLAFARRTETGQEKNSPNKTPQSTAPSVTPPAGQEARQP
jgi:hypothetical protein